MWREFLREIFSPDQGFLKEQLQLNSPTTVSSLKQVGQSLKTTDHPVSPIKMHLKMESPV